MGKHFIFVGTKMNLLYIYICNYKLLNKYNFIKISLVNNIITNYLI